RGQSRLNPLQHPHITTTTSNQGSNDLFLRRPLTSWHWFNRMLGQLFHCLQTRQHFDEHRAFTSPVSSSLTAAA
ncbi:hypothetical protein ACIQB5_50700, partial [Streptomyces sp. NPDC088560]